MIQVDGVGHQAEEMNMADHILAGKAAAQRINTSHYCSHLVDQASLMLSILNEQESRALPYAQEKNWKYLGDSINVYQDVKAYTWNVQTLTIRCLLSEPYSLAFIDGLLPNLVRNCQTKRENETVKIQKKFFNSLNKSEMVLVG